MEIKGPPDGWCYEGKHTTDLKRARFRADSTPQDDKLVSCLRLNCHGIRSQLPRSAGRKRPRARINYNDQSADDEDVSEGEADSGMEEIVQGNGKPKAKPKVKTPKSVKGKAKAKEGEDVEDKMQVDDDKGMNEEEEEEDGASRTGSVRGRAKAKGKSKVAKHTLKNTSPSPKRRGRPPKSQAQLLAKELTPSTPGGSTLTPTPASSTKRRGRQFKSKEFIEDSDDEEPGTITPSVIGSTTSPEKRKRKVTGSSSLSPLRGDSPRTRSQSRTRSTGKRKLEVRTPLRPHMAKRKVVELELELGGSGDEGEGASEEENGEKEEEEKPRKKRKT